MIAVKRLQSLFWVLLVALGALGAYLVSLRVATERNELMRVRTQIAQARADIRYLETEFGARANMRQLERWNAEDFRYSALPADHYLDDERQLAHLDGMEANGPDYVAQPVMVAMIQTGENGESALAQPAPSPAALQIRSDEATIRAVKGAEVRAQAAVPAPARLAAAGRVVELAAIDKPVARAAGRKAEERAEARTDKATRRPTAQSGSLARKAERMAMLDARLLDDHTLGDIGRRAASETRRGRR